MISLNVLLKGTAVQVAEKRVSPIHSPHPDFPSCSGIQSVPSQPKTFPMHCRLEQIKLKKKRKKDYSCYKTMVKSYQFPPLIEAQL